MEIQRQQELVEHYHYDFKLPETKGESELKVGFAPLEKPADYPAENTILGARLEFTIYQERFVITGSVSQLNHIINRKVEQQSDLTKEEINEIAAPLFTMVQRLTREVTEVTFDEPGIVLNFNSEGTDAAAQ